MGYVIGQEEVAFYYFVGFSLGVPSVPKTWGNNPLPPETCGDFKKGWAQV